MQVRNPAPQPVAERADGWQQEHGAAAARAKRCGQEPMQPAQPAATAVQGGQYAQHGRRGGVLQDPTVLNHRQRRHQPRRLAQEPPV